MRFDDTNPAKEDIEYVHSILRDVRWLTGSEDSDPWHGPVRHASDYFDATYDAAMHLVKAGKAYVDDSTPGNCTHVSCPCVTRVLSQDLRNIHVCVCAQSNCERCAAR